MRPVITALHDPDGGVRWMAAYALGRLGDLRACDALAERLNDTNVNVRWGALWALAELHDPRVVDQLISVLRGPHWRFPFSYSRRHHLHPSHKPRAQRALEMIGDPAVEPLIRVLEGGFEPEYAKVCAAESLGRLGDRRAVGPLLYVGEANSAVRRAAIDALGHLQAPEATGPLILIREDPSTTPEIARAADGALTAIASSPAQPELVKAAGDVVGCGAARAAALDLSEIDARFSPDVIESCVRRLLVAWEAATKQTAPRPRPASYLNSGCASCWRPPVACRGSSANPSSAVSPWPSLMPAPAPPRSRCSAPSAPTPICGTSTSAGS